MGGVGCALIFAAMVLFEFRRFGFQFIAYYLFFYMLGQYLRKYSVRFPATVTALLGVAWFGMALFWRMHQVPAPLQGIPAIPPAILIYSYRLVTATLGSLFFLSMAQHLFTTRQCPLLSLLGTISLEIYIIHLFFGFVSYRAIGVLGMSAGTLPAQLFDFVFRLALSLVIILPIVRINPLSVFLFGRTHGRIRLRRTATAA